MCKIARSKISGVSWLAVSRGHSMVLPKPTKRPLSASRNSLPSYATKGTRAGERKSSMCGTGLTLAPEKLSKRSGEARSYYDGGTGQSGGEKRKLAFLVLVAAIGLPIRSRSRCGGKRQIRFVMVDEMFSRSDDTHAEYALDLFARFGLQLLIVAPLDAKARVCELMWHVSARGQKQTDEPKRIGCDHGREVSRDGGLWLIWRPFISSSLRRTHRLQRTD